MGRDRNKPNAGDVQTFNGTEWVPLSFLQAIAAAGFILLVDALTYFIDDIDNTKRAQLQLSGLSPGATRILTLLDSDITLAGSSGAMTTGRMVYTIAGGVLAASANALWDGTNFDLSAGAGTFKTPSGAVSLNGATTCASTIAVSSTTNSIDATTGCAVLSGGMGMAGSLYSAKTANGAGVVFQFTNAGTGNAYSTVTLAQVNGSKYCSLYHINDTYASTGAYQAGSGLIEVQGSTAGGFGIYLRNGGGFKVYDSGASAQLALTNAGILTLNNATDATAIGTAASVFSGGASFAKTVISANGRGVGVTSTATAASTTTLTIVSDEVQSWTGSTAGKVIQFPAANLLGAGVAVCYTVNDQSSVTVTPTRAGSDTFQGGGTTDPVTAGASQSYRSDGVSVWMKV